MISNRNLNLVLFGIWLLISIRLGIAANLHADWQGFVVTQVQLVTASLALSWMLRKPH